MVAQMYKWKQLDLLFQVDSIPFLLHTKVIKDLKEQWDEFLTIRRLKLEKCNEDVKQLRQLKEQNEILQKEKEKMIELAQELLGCIPPSLACPLFLHE